jgi:hypothetical protein
VNAWEKLRILDTLDVYELLNECLKELAEDIILMNQNQMYEQGIMDITKPSEKEYYAPATMRQKKKSAQYKKTAFVTLKWEGEFYDSMKLEVFGKDNVYAFDIIASDEKWQDWLSQNPRFENALGLTKGNVKVLAETVRPMIYKKIRDKLK